MDNKKKIPSSEFTEADVDQLIANYGVKPSDKEQARLDHMLKEQREVFEEVQKDRGDKGESRER